MKNLRLTLLAALVLAASSAVQAQDAPAAGAPAADTGTVSNAPAAATTTTNPGISAESGAEGTSESTSVLTETSETTKLSDTGGEPLLLSLGGMSLAMGAFFLRRRVTN